MNGWRFHKRDKSICAQNFLLRHQLKRDSFYLNRLLAPYSQKSRELLLRPIDKYMQRGPIGKSKIHPQHFKGKETFSAYHGQREKFPCSEVLSPSLQRIGRGFTVWKEVPFGFLLATSLHTRHFPSRSSFAFSETSMYLPPSSSLIMDALLCSIFLVFLSLLLLFGPPPHNCPQKVCTTNIPCLLSLSLSLSAAAVDTTHAPLLSHPIPYPSQTRIPFGFHVRWIGYGGRDRACAAAENEIE